MDAIKFAFRAGVRTFAQGTAGGLSAIAVMSLVDVEKLPQTVAVVFAAQVIAGLAAFFQNWAEQL